MTDLTVHRAPEDDHLAEQERLLADLTEQLATKETEFATSGAEFARFRAAYLHRFAPLYSELDRLEAEIARLLAVAEDTPAAHQRAQEAASRAADSEEAAGAAGAREDQTAAEDETRAVDADLRDLYRRAAKVVHPDTAGTDEERERRTRVMAAINEAYERGDAEAIRRILDGEGARPESVEGSDVGSKLIRTLRKIAQVRARFTELIRLQEALEADPMWQLFDVSREAWLAGEDPLADDEEDLRSRISSAQARLAALIMANNEQQPPAHA